MTRNRNKILIPEARKELDELKSKVAGVNHPNDAKFEVASEIGVSHEKGYNGRLTSEEAGKVGGVLGGRMVQELIKMAKEELNKKL